jgi:hypothetical protein
MTHFGTLDRFTNRVLERLKGEIQRVEEKNKNENEQMRDLYFTRIINDKIEERNAKVKHTELKLKHIELQNEHIALLREYTAVLKTSVQKEEAAVLRAKKEQEEATALQEPPTKRARACRQS